jgi:hypothetical protein
MRLRSLLMGMGLFGAAAALVFAQHRVSRAEAELAGIKRSLGDINDKMSRVEEAPRPPLAVVTVERAAARAAVSPTEGEGGERSSPAPPAPAASSQEDQKAFLELSFSKQAPDMSWSREAKAEVTELFQPLTNQDTRLVSADCRTTLCRVELAHTGDEAFHAFMASSMNGVMRGWKGPGGGGLLRTDADGTMRAVFYLAKEGTELPILD